VIRKCPRRLRAQHPSVCSVHTRLFLPVDTTSNRVTATPWAAR